jgi:hypothetical protein
VVIEYGIGSANGTTVVIESSIWLGMVFEKHFSEFGINRQYFGLQKQIHEKGFRYWLGWIWYCDAFVLSWGFSFGLAWFGRDLALAVGVFCYIYA